MVVSVVIGSGFHLLAVVYYMIGGFGLIGFLMCKKVFDDLLMLYEQSRKKKVLLFCFLFLVSLYFLIHGLYLVPFFLFFYACALLELLLYFAGLWCINRCRFGSFYFVKQIGSGTGFAFPQYLFV